MHTCERITVRQAIRAGRVSSTHSPRPTTQRVSPKNYVLPSTWYSIVRYVCKIHWFHQDTVGTTSHHHPSPITHQDQGKFLDNTKSQSKFKEYSKNIQFKEISFQRNFREISKEHSKKVQREFKQRQIQRRLTEKSSSTSGRQGSTYFIRTPAAAKPLPDAGAFPKSHVSPVTNTYVREACC